MKCPTCNTDMVWQGSMLDGSMACPSCVASDTMAQGLGCDAIIVIDDPLAPSFTYVDYDSMTADEWKESLRVRDKIGLARFAPYHYMLGNGQQAILSPEAADEFEDWMAIGGCSCHQGHAPCSSCTHPGHPASLENRDDCVVFT